MKRKKINFQVETIDVHILNYLQTLVNSKLLENTIFIMWGDHGARGTNFAFVIFYDFYKRKFF
jgi:arylsulfatase A-like enzyme